MTEETNKASGEDVLALPTLPHPMLMPPPTSPTAHG